MLDKTNKMASKHSESRERSGAARPSVPQQISGEFTFARAKGPPSQVVRNQCCIFECRVKLHERTVHCWLFGCDYSLDEIKELSQQAAQAYAELRCVYQKKGQDVPAFFSCNWSSQMIVSVDDHLHEEVGHDGIASFIEFPYKSFRHEGDYYITPKNLFPIQFGTPDNPPQANNLRSLADAKDPKSLADQMAKMLQMPREERINKFIQAKLHVDVALYGLIAKHGHESKEVKDHIAKVVLETTEAYARQMEAINPKMAVTQYDHRLDDSSIVNEGFVYPYEHLAAQQSAELFRQRCATLQQRYEAAGDSQELANKKARFRASEAVDQDFFPYTTTDEDEKYYGGRAYPRRGGDYKLRHWTEPVISETTDQIIRQNEAIPDDHEDLHRYHGDVCVGQNCPYEDALEIDVAVSKYQLDRIKRRARETLDVDEKQWNRTTKKEMSVFGQTFQQHHDIKACMSESVFDSCFPHYSAFISKEELLKLPLDMKQLEYLADWHPYLLEDINRENLIPYILQSSSYIKLMVRHQEIKYRQGKAKIVKLEQFIWPREECHLCDTFFCMPEYDHMTDDDSTRREGFIFPYEHFDKCDNLDAMWAELLFVNSHNSCICQKCHAVVLRMLSIIRKKTVCDYHTFEKNYAEYVRQNGTKQDHIVNTSGFTYFQKHRECVSHATHTMTAEDYMKKQLEEIERKTINPRMLATGFQRLTGLDRVVGTCDVVGGIINDISTDYRALSDRIKGIFSPSQGLSDSQILVLVSVVMQLVEFAKTRSLTLIGSVTSLLASLCSGKSYFISHAIQQLARYVRDVPTQVSNGEFQQRSGKDNFEMAPLIGAVSAFLFATEAKAPTIKRIESTMRMINPAVLVIKSTTKLVDFIIDALPVCVQATIFHYIPSLQKLDFMSRDDVKEWIKRCAEYSQTGFGVTHSNTIQVKMQIAKDLALRKQYFSEAVELFGEKSLPQMFLEANRQILKIGGYIKAANESNEKARMCPMWIYICGEPGVGKSKLAEKIATVFFSARFLNEMPKNEGELERDWLKRVMPIVRAKCIYAKSIGSKYFDNYDKQPVIWVDDYGQANNQITGVAENIGMISMCSATAAMAEQASVELKGMTIESEMIITTSNFDIPQMTDCHSQKALLRRRNLVIYASVDPAKGICVPGADGQPSYMFNPAHSEEDQLIFHELNTYTGDPCGRKMNLVQFLDKINQSLKEHREQQKKADVLSELMLDSIFRYGPVHNENLDDQMLADLRNGTRTMDSALDLPFEDAKTSNGDFTQKMFHATYSTEDKVADVDVPLVQNVQTYETPEEAILAAEETGQDMLVRNGNHFIYILGRKVDRRIRPFNYFYRLVASFAQDASEIAEVLGELAWEQMKKYWDEAKAAFDNLSKTVQYMIIGAIVTPMAGMLFKFLFNAFTKEEEKPGLEEKGQWIDGVPLTSEFFEMKDRKRLGVIAKKEVNTLLDKLEKEDLDVFFAVRDALSKIDRYGILPLEGRVDDAFEFIPKKQSSGEIMVTQTYDEKKAKKPVRIVPQRTTKSVRAKLCLGEEMRRFHLVDPIEAQIVAETIRKVRNKDWNNDDSLRNIISEIKLSNFDRKKYVDDLPKDAYLNPKKIFLDALFVLDEELYKGTVDLLKNEREWTMADDMDHYDRCHMTEDEMPQHMRKYLPVVEEFTQKMQANGKEGGALVAANVVNNQCMTFSSHLHLFAVGLCNSTVGLTLVRDDSRVGSVFGIMLGDDLLLTVKHFFSISKEGDTLVVTDYKDGNKKNFNFKYTVKRLHQFEGKDAAVYHLTPGVMPLKPRIVMKFMTSREQLQKEVRDAAIPSFSTKDYCMYIKEVVATRADTTHSLFGELTDGSAKVVTQTALCWQAPVFALDGSCGIPIFDTSPETVHRIMGFHIGGNNTTASFVVMTQEDLLDVFEKFGCMKKGASGVEEVFVKKREPQYQCPMRYHTFGASALVGGVTDKTSLRKSEIFEMVHTDVPFGHIKEPGVLARSDKRSDGTLLVQAGQEKYCVELPGLDDALIDEVYTYLAEKSVQQLSRNYARLLTYSECVNGIEDEPLSKRMNLATSPGWPFAHVADGKKKQGILTMYDKFGKLTKLTENMATCCMTADFEDHVKICETMLRQGQMVCFMFTETLKDELKSIEKINRTRLFMAAPAVHTVLVRRYFQGYMIAMQKNKLQSYSAVGMDPDSDDFNVLGMKLSKISTTNCHAFDFKAFDTRLHGALMAASVKPINAWYRANSSDSEEKLKEAETVRELLIESVVHAMSTYRDSIHQKPQGNASGWGATTDENSVTGNGMLRMMYSKLVPPEFSSQREFDRNVVSIHYGDDVVIAVSEDVVEYFNGQTIQPLCQQMFGMEITSARKDGFMPKVIPLSECTFLKRQFHYSSEWNKFVGVYPWDELVEQLNWVRKSDDPIGQLESNIEDVLHLAVTHGREKFEKLRTDIMQALRAKKIGFIPPSWGDVYSQHFSKYYPDHDSGYIDGVRRSFE